MLVTLLWHLNVIKRENKVSLTCFSFSFAALNNIKLIHEAEEYIFYIIPKDEEIRYHQNVSWAIRSQISEYSDYVFHYV